MLKTLFVSHDEGMNKALRNKFTEDFIAADKIILKIIFAYGFIVAFMTSWQNGYFKLGIIGGGLVVAISFLAYKTMAGTLLCRNILATALVAMMAITIQQANGLGEGHFLFFLNFTILIRYRDIAPLITLVVLTVLHHLTLTYCQSVGVEMLGSPLTIFSWGEQSDLGLLAPLVYHVVIAVLGAIVATWYIYDLNTKFLEANGVILVLDKASEGDLSVRVDKQVETSLTRNVNQFFSGLSSFMASMRDTASQLSQLAIDEAESAERRLSQAKEQQSQVLSVSGSVSEMSESTQEIARTAEQTASSINETTDTSEKGRQLAQSFSQSIKKLAENVNKASGRIAELEQNSTQIQSIVGTIRDISEQTNLLALNAAIEAARAGEQGRGFAVVADEVRVLSQRTHNSTEEISKMVDAFRSSTNSAVETMSECAQLSESSVEEASVAAISFEDIANNMREINQMATQIATAAEEQTLVTGEINTNTTRITEVSDSFYADAQQSAEEAESLRKLALNIEDNLVQYRTE